MTDRYHPGEDADDPDLEDVATDHDAPDVAADRLDELTSAPSADPEGIAITDETLDTAACRFCRAELPDRGADADHDCDGRREHRLEQGLADEQLAPQTHELGAKLLFHANGLDPYFGIVSEFDACLQGEDGDDVGTFKAAGDTWELNHDEEKVNYHQGAIATRPQDSGDAYYEYTIGVVATDAVRRKRITFQFRPALPNAVHAETGDRIQSLPADLPEGLRVQVSSANVDLKNVVPVLRGLATAMGITPDYFIERQLHEWSRVYNLASYVRIRRDLSEQHVVGREGLLDRLSSFASARRGMGEYKWDNEEIVGHMNAVTLNPQNLSHFYDGHHVGKLLKSYHMKNPEESMDPDDATTQPKLEVQYSTEYSRNDTVPWRSAEGIDIYDVQEELEEWLLNSLAWAGLPTNPDPSVYVADEYWDVQPREESVEIRADPMPALEEQRQDLAEYHVLREDLSPGERSVLQAIADGGQLHYQAAAEQADVGESTVYRAAKKLSDVVDRAHGELRLTDEVVADKVSELFAGLEDTAQWIEGQVSKLARDEGYLSEDSTFAKWMRTHGVGIQEHRQRVELELHGGRYTIDEVRRVLRAGYDAARQAGPNLADRLLDAAVAWTDPDGERHGPQRAFTIQGNSAIFAVGASTQRDVG